MESGYIHVDESIFPTLLALSIEEQQYGLMGQEWPPPVMSFLYTSAQINKFWMKNTPSPLDILFCHKGQVTQICHGEPYSTNVIGENKLSDLIIEMPYGTVKSSNITIGNSVGLVAPTQDELRKIIAKKYHNLIKF